MTVSREFLHTASSDRNMLSQDDAVTLIMTISNEIILLAASSDRNMLSQDDAVTLIMAVSIENILFTASSDE